MARGAVALLHVGRARRVAVARGARRGQVDGAVAVRLARHVALQVEARMAAPARGVGRVGRRGRGSVARGAGRLQVYVHGAVAVPRVERTGLVEGCVAGVAVVGRGVGRRRRVPVARRAGAAHVDGAVHVARGVQQRPLVAHVVVAGAAVGVGGVGRGGWRGVAGVADAGPVGGVVPRGGRDEPALERAPVAPDGRARARLRVVRGREAARGRPGSEDQVGGQAVVDVPRCVDRGRDQVAVAAGQRRGAQGREVRGVGPQRGAVGRAPQVAERRRGAGAEVAVVAAGLGGVGGRAALACLTAGDEPGHGEREREQAGGRHLHP